MPFGNKPNQIQFNTQCMQHLKRNNLKQNTSTWSKERMQLFLENHWEPNTPIQYGEERIQPDLGREKTIFRKTWIILIGYGEHRGYEHGCHHAGYCMLTTPIYYS